MKTYAFTVVHLTYVDGEPAWDKFATRMSEKGAQGWHLRELLSSGTHGRVAALMERAGDVAEPQGGRL